MITLDQIEQLMNRTGASYEVVRDALRATEGDMFKALLLVEQAQENDGRIDYEAFEAQQAEEKDEEPRTFAEDAEPKQENKAAASAQAILDKLSEVLRRFDASSIRIQKGDTTVLNLSATLGALGLILAPIAAVIGLGAALVTDYSIIVTLDDGREININDAAKEQMDQVNQFARTEYDNVKAGFQTYSERTRESRENRRKDQKVAEEEGFTATYETEASPEDAEDAAKEENAEEPKE